MNWHTAPSKNKGQINGLETGWYDLDRLTTGLHPNELIIIAARPAMGKTAFALNLATHVAMTQDKTVALFTLEMPVKSLISRVVSSNLKMSVKAMYLDVNEIEIDQKPLDALSELPIYYYEYGGTPDQIYHYVSELKTIIGDKDYQTFINPSINEQETTTKNQRFRKN